MTFIPPCPQNWETCDTCGARPEEGCLDPDVTERTIEEIMSYKAAYIPTGLQSVSPEHYSRHSIEPIDFIELNNLGFSVGNAIKYLVRYDAKNGLEDLYKAKRYVEFLIQKELGLSPSSAAD